MVRLWIVASSVFVGSILVPKVDSLLERLERTSRLDEQLRLYREATLLAVTYQDDRSKSLLNEVQSLVEKTNTPLGRAVWGQLRAHHLRSTGEEGGEDPLLLQREAAEQYLLAGDTTEAAVVLARTASQYRGLGDIPAYTTTMTLLVELGDRTSDLNAKATANLMEGSRLWYGGDPTAGRERFERGLAAARATSERAASAPPIVPRITTARGGRTNTFTTT